MIQPGAQPPLLAICGLRTYFDTEAGVAKAVDGVDLEIRRGEVLGLVGESGSGKSVTALSVLRLVPSPPGRIVAGEVRFKGRNLLELPWEEIRKVRGREISMIFQEPMTSLNPVFTIGMQVTEMILQHEPVSKEEAGRRATAMLTDVGIPDAAARMKQYPHHLSGGMRQRVMIAMALVLNPDLLIADEPTTALDVTIQAQILDLMLDLKARRPDAAILLITHNLAVVAETCDRVAVMYGGKVQEVAPVRRLFENPLHPYTQGLLGSIPRVDGKRAHRLHVIPGTVPDIHEMPAGCKFTTRCPERFEPCMNTEPRLIEMERTIWSAATSILVDVPTPDDVILDVQHLTVRFPVSGGVFLRRIGEVRAVEDVSFTIGRGETLGLVGESGCGKTTVGRAIVNILKAMAYGVEVSGRILYHQGGAVDLAALSRRGMRPYRSDIQMVFQDPYASLNPRKTVAQIVGEPLAVHSKASAGARAERVRWLLEKVGLSPEQANRYPHEFSGGQRQRIGIARALATNPKLVIADEPVSALDVSVQAQVINLMQDLQQEFGLSFLFIGHDLSVVRHISDRIAVMYLGRIVEMGAADVVYSRPLHPYSRALLAAAPRPDPSVRRAARATLGGDVPSPLHKPSGCVFRTRCPIARPACAQEDPPLVLREGRAVACPYSE